MIHILLLFVGCVVPFALGCSCIQDHPQNSFCGATAVFRGNVTEETLIRGGWGRVRRRIYTLDVQKIYKDESGQNLTEGSPINVSTAGDGAMCGITLTVGDVYIITAHGGVGSLGVGLCTRQINLTGYTTTQIEQIKYEYDCRCKVHTGWGTVKDGERHKYCFMFEAPVDGQPQCQQLSFLCSLDETTNKCSFCKKTK